MRRSTIGALLLLLLGIGGVFGWSYLRPLLFEKSQIGTSDASGSTKIRVGGDNFLGYWFVTSPEARKQMARKGLAVEFEDDGGAYADRLEAFAAGEYDCIVLPINSYLFHGRDHRYPGVIVAAISESRGADGVVGFGDRFPNRNVSEFNDPNLRVVYTSESPSSFLLDLMIADFDLFHLQGSDTWRHEVGGSTEAYDLSKKKEGDAFVMWEPDLSKALDENPDLVQLWGSDRFAGYILDVFVFRRDFLEKNAGAVDGFFQSYFQVLKLYGNNQEQMVKEMSKSSGLKKRIVESILPKIEWFDLQENCNLQFGLSTSVDIPASEGVVNSIIACTDVYLRTGKLDSDPLSGNPYLITNRTVLEGLLRRMPTAVGGSGQAAFDFPELSETDWASLREVGTMRVEPITFQKWNNLLTTEGKGLTDRYAALLANNYPDYRVAVRGHTGSGDEVENVQLSLERAQAVVQRLTAVHGIDPDRLHSEGWGSKAAPPRKPDESARAYRYRLSRVEFVLLEGGAL